MTSTTRKRGGCFRGGAGGSGLRGFGGTKIGSCSRSPERRWTFSRGTMFAPVPFVSVSSTHLPICLRVVGLARLEHALVERLGAGDGAQRAPDDEALDLARALEDRVELGVAVPLL